MQGQGSMPFVLATPSRAFAAASPSAQEAQAAEAAAQMAELQEHIRQLESEIAQAALRQRQLLEAYAAAVSALEMVMMGQAGEQ
ncbi:hypothetical protein BXU09_18660 [Deinococcus sp. LM3]|nr:hypothetical protein BXU09_18660 [Deinococcus sp. LM3]